MKIQRATSAAVVPLPAADGDSFNDNSNPDPSTSTNTNPNPNSNPNPNPEPGLNPKPNPTQNPNPSPGANPNDSTSPSQPAAAGPATVAGASLSGSPMNSNNNAVHHQDQQQLRARDSSLEAASRRQRPSQSHEGAYPQDTRTHVVGELYDTERSYVESLQIIIEVSCGACRLSACRPSSSLKFQ